MVTDATKDTTEVGNYFIANYPPFSFWKEENLPVLRQTLSCTPAEDVPLGLYLHIPFCRKRCKFCYFRVYTDINASAIQEYVYPIKVSGKDWREDRAKDLKKRFEG